MPLHRKPTHRLRTLAAALGVALTVSGVAFAAQVGIGHEQARTAPEPLTATSAPSSPLSSPAPSAEGRGDRDVRPSRDAQVRRGELTRTGSRKPESAGPSSPQAPSETAPVPETDPDPTVTGSTETADRTPAPTRRVTASDDGILGDTNAARRSAGEPALRVSSCLTRMAQRHAERLAAAGSLHHQELGAVMSSCGMSAAGENVAMNHSGPSDMVDQWLRSPGHRENLLSSRFSLIGVGVAQARDGAWYAVQVFGAG